MRNRLLVFGLLACLFTMGGAQQAHAQTNAGPSNHIGWVQQAVTLEVAQSYVYTYRDLGVMGTSLTGVVCSKGANATDHSCVGNLPSNLTPGPHSFTLVAIDPTTLTPLESAESVALSFQFRTRPTTPINLAIRP
jgi:hypothetical protein